MQLALALELQLALAIDSILLYGIGCQALALELQLDLELQLALDIDLMLLEGIGCQALALELQLTLALDLHATIWHKLPASGHLNCNWTWLLAYKLFSPLTYILH